MSEANLRTIDGFELSEQHRQYLKPGEVLHDASGIGHRLPRFFFEVPSWREANDVMLTPHFKLAELMMVDLREADLLLREFPHYVPCAVAVLAHFLEAFRRAVDSPVYVGANGGYRSPAHQLHNGKNVHSWGTAANIYRVGSSYLDGADTIEKYAGIAKSLSRQVYVKPYAEGDDYLHVDLGFITVTPRDRSDDE